MHSFPSSLIIISVVLEHSLGRALGFTSQESLAFSLMIFFTGLLLLNKVKDRDDVSSREVVYSDEFKAKTLFKYMCLWFGFALFIDVLIAGLLEDQFWSNINPFDSRFLFVILFFMATFASSLKVDFYADNSKIKCSRLGFVTSRITGFNSVDISENEVIIISQDDGKFIFKLGRFSKPVRDALVAACRNLPDKSLK